MSSQAINYEAGIHCGSCLQFKHWQVTEGNANGNKGRIYVQCKQLRLVKQPDGSTLEFHCNFFRWKSSSIATSTPVNSQPVTPTATPSQSLPSLVMPSVSLLTPAAQDYTRCGYPTPTGACGRKPNSQCHRLQCKNHCLALGGCSTTGHSPLSVTVHSPPPSQAAPPTSQSTLSTSPNDAHIPTSNTQVPSATTQAQPLPSTSSAPRYASHIEPIFYEGMAHQLRHEKAKQLKELSRLEAMVRTKHEVTVFGWPENGTEPRPAVLQEGYAFPRFRITDDVLAEVGLATEGCIPPRFELFKPEYSFWTRIAVDHVVMVDKSPLVFLRALGVNDCPCFCDLSSAPARSSNIRTNLTAERQEAQQLLYDSFVQAPSSQTTSSSKRWRDSGDKTPRRKKKAIDSSDESDNDHRDRGRQRTRTARPRRKCPSPFVHHDFDYAPLTPYNPPPSPRKLTDDEEDDLPSAATLSISRHSISSRSSSSASGLSKFGSSTSDTDTSSSSQSRSHSQSQSQSCSESPVVQASTLTDMEDPEDKTDASSSSADESPSSSSNDEENVSWPNSFYVSDLVGFFTTHRRLPKEVLAKQFKEAFGIEWTKSAYYYHLQVWDDCHDSEAKEAALKAGYTPEGSWTLFCKRYPHKSVVAKAEKRRQRDFQKAQSAEMSAKSKSKQPVKTRRVLLKVTPPQ